MVNVQNPVTLNTGLHYNCTVVKLVCVRVSVPLCLGAVFAERDLPRISFAVCFVCPPGSESSRSTVEVWGN